MTSFVCRSTYICLLLHSPLQGEQKGDHLYSSSMFDLISLKPGFKPTSFDPQIWYAAVVEDIVRISYKGIYLLSLGLRICKQ